MLINLIEYTGIESNAYQFAEAIVDKALENKSGLFLKRDISVTGVEFAIGKPSGDAIGVGTERIFW